MEKAKDIRRCERCLRDDMEIIGVWASVLGACSFGGCLECLGNRCEPLGVVEWVILVNGGWQGVAPWVKEIGVYKDGKYQKAGDCIPEPTDEQKAVYKKELDALCTEHDAYIDGEQNG